ncbi:unnamed protein product [Anisakis simplex]|uniref:HMG box domain-containing protein n=1 Tax=Anisakis simplex TaxID=6269 RepID=A0A0M3JW44_ANISI|nr:unnamed protein product [Anisakis simplex]
MRLDHFSEYTTTASVTKPKEESRPSGFRKTPPFAIFLKEHFVKKDGVKVTEAMKELKNRWNLLGAIEKKKYFDESEAELKAKIAKFDALSVEEKQKLLDESAKQREERKRRRNRAEKAAKREEANRPVRPSSAYNLYIKEKMDSTERTPEKIRARFSEAAAAWKTLPDSEKQKYISQADALAKKFAKDMAAWKEANEKEKKLKNETTAEKSAA